MEGGTGLTHEVTCVTLQLYAASQSDNDCHLSECSEGRAYGAPLTHAHTIRSIRMLIRHYTVSGGVSLLQISVGLTDNEFSTNGRTC